MQGDVEAIKAAAVEAEKLEFAKDGIDIVSALAALIHPQGCDLIVASPMLAAVQQRGCARWRLG